MAECESLMRELLKHGAVEVQSATLVWARARAVSKFGVLIDFPGAVWSWDYIRDVRPGPGNTYYSRSIKCELGYN